jgi:hypothetical protein
MPLLQERFHDVTLDSNPVARPNQHLPILEGASVDQSTATYAVGRWGNDVTVRVFPEGPERDRELRRFKKQYPRHSVGTVAPKKGLNLNGATFGFSPKDSKAQAQKNAVISFVDALSWDLFGTIGVGSCPDDDKVLNRLRRIEARLNRRFFCVAYHKLAITERIAILVAFEGVRNCGTRHCHFLVSCPVPRKELTSRDLLIDAVLAEIPQLWSKFAVAEQDKQDGFSKRWADVEPIMMRRSGDGAADYTLKSHSTKTIGSEAGCFKWDK